jgi:hypothetical protein
MNPVILTYNGININDTTNFEAYFPAGMISRQPNIQLSEVMRGNMLSPILAGKTMPGGWTLTLVVICKGTFATQIDTLKGYLSVYDPTPRALIIKDIGNSDKQWYVNATPIGMPDVNGNEVTFTLSVSDPVWRSVTENSSSWSITASGQTKAITVAGNQPAYPKLEITPTVAGGSGFGYRSWVALFSNSVNALVDYPVNICGTVLDTAALVADNANKCQINNGAGITAAATTIAYDTVAGTVPTVGMGYVDTEQIAWTGRTGTTSGNLTGCTRGLNGTTAATHADNAVIRVSKIQADGDDLRVYVDGVETSRWLQGMNSANTKIWIVGNWKPKVRMTGPVVGSGALTSVTFPKSTSNNALIAKLAKWAGKNFTLYVGTEAIEISAATINITTRKITGTFTRGAKGTTAAAHALGDVWYWLEHEIYIYYGNATMTTPDQDETRKPIIDLTSTNTSWVYALFKDAAGLRAGGWKDALVATDNKIDTEYQSDSYTGVRLLNADPGTEMGMSIQSFRNGTLWKAEQANLQWRLFHPCGVTTVTASGEKYRNTSSFPSATCQYSGDGAKWLTLWTDATPASASTWTALAAHSAIGLGATYNWLRFKFAGTQPASSAAQADYSITDVTLALDSTLTPTIVVGAESSCYQLQCTVTNTTTGDAFVLDVSLPLNATVTVDTDTRTLTMPDGRDNMGAITWSGVRTHWLEMPAGANTLQYDDTGTAGVTLVTKWRDRNS